MIAAIDVDATVVDSPYYWYLWLEDMTKAGYKYENVCKFYNFSEVYANIWLDKNIAGHPLDFWRAKHVYQGMQPMQDSVTALKLLKESGYKIVFVSALKGDHHYSKYRFLEKHFPFMDGFVGTKEKWAVNADIIIDDRNKFLNMFDKESVYRIKMNTPFDQDEQLNVEVKVIDSWYDMIKAFK